MTTKLEGFDLAADAAVIGASAPVLVALALRDKGAKDRDGAESFRAEFNAAFAARWVKRFDAASAPLQAAVLAWGSKNIPGVTDADKVVLRGVKGTASKAFDRGVDKLFGVKPRTVVQSGKGDGKGQGATPDTAATTAGEAAVLGPEQSALALAGHFIKDDPDAVEALAHLLQVVASNAKAREAAAKAVAKIVK